MEYMYQTVDKDFVETIVGKLKSQGIFDQFRKDCLADVDTKPAYQNLQERVNGTVASFLEKHKWQETLNKTQLRESLRRHVQQGFLETGVDRIVDQVVNPKIYTVFKPKVEDVVYDSLGIPKPNRPDKDRNLLNFILKHPPPPHPPPPPPPPVTNSVKSNNSTKLEDLLPKDLDPISPGSVEDLSLSPKVEEQTPDAPSVEDQTADVPSVEDQADEPNATNNNDSPAFEPLGVPEASNEESKLSVSDLTSHGSTKNSLQTVLKPEQQLDTDQSNTDSAGKKLTDTVSSQFKNFSNLNEKIKQAEIKHTEELDASVKDEDSSDRQSDMESGLEQDSAEKLEGDDSQSVKIHSEDSRSSVSSLNRDKKSLSLKIDKEVNKDEDKFDDSEKTIKENPEECDSNLSNIEKTESKTEETEKKEEKVEKKHSDSSSSKHRSSRHSSHESKHRSHERKDDKSKSSKSDKDRKHHDDRHKSSKDKSSKDREGSHKDDKSKGKEDTDSDKHKHSSDKSSRHRESDDKYRDDRGRYKENSEKLKEDKGKGEKSERSKHRHSEDKSAYDRSDRTKYPEVDDKLISSRDPLGLMELGDQDELSDRASRDAENEDKKDDDDPEKSEKIRSLDYEKEEKIEKSDKSRRKEERSDKVRSKDNEDKHKESRKQRELEDKHRSDKSSERSEKAEKAGRHKETEEKVKEERSSKSEKVKHKGEEEGGDDKGRKSNKHSINMDSEPSSSSSSTKEERTRNDDKETDKEKNRKHSSGTGEKSKSKHSSSSKHSKEDKKNRESRKRKGERCEDVKIKESRRSSDRDHNGPGSSSSSSSGRNKDVNSSGSSSKTNETFHENSGQDGSSSVEENAETSPDVPNDVDILLMKINDSIENDLEESKKNLEDTPDSTTPASVKKPKIANNIFEIKKIMQARRYIEKMEALEEITGREKMESTNTVEPSKVTETEYQSDNRAGNTPEENDAESMELNRQIQEELAELQPEIEEVPNILAENEAESIELNRQIQEKLAELQPQTEEIVSTENETESAELNQQLQQTLAELQSGVEDSSKLNPEIEDITTDISMENESESAELNKQIQEKLAEIQADNEEPLCVLRKNEANIKLNGQIEEKGFQSEGNIVSVEINKIDKEAEESSFIKKPRIANNIYEVRKIMHMKKRLEKMQKLAKEENLKNGCHSGSLEASNEEAILECENLDEEVQDEEILPYKLAGKQEIRNALENTDITPLDSHTNEECPDDNAENEEPKPLRTPKIAKNIHEVRKIIRARKALKRKIKFQTKNIELSVSRKHIKNLLNSKKLLTTKRRGEQVIKLKLITKDRKFKLKKDNSSKTRKLLGRKDNREDISEDLKRKDEECSSSVPLIEKNKENDEKVKGITKETSESWQEIQDCFIGFSENELNIAVRQFEELTKYVKVSRISQQNEQLDNMWSSKLDGNSNMVKSSTLNRSRKRHTVTPTVSENEKKSNHDYIQKNHDKFIRDILTGKNGCSIKLTKNAGLDARAKNAVFPKKQSLQKKSQEMDTDNQYVDSINSNLQERMYQINSELNDRSYSTTMTEAMLDNLMKESNLMPGTDEMDYEDSLSNSEENFKIISRNKKNSLGKDVENFKETNRNENNQTTKEKIHNNKEHNLAKKSNALTNNNGEPPNKVKNITVTQEEKPKRATRTSLRSTQRYDSTDLYKPRLTLSLNSSRTRANRAECAEKSTPNATETLQNLRRKIR